MERRTTLSLQTHYLEKLEGRQSTQLSRFPDHRQRSAMGHEERFPMTWLGGGCGFRKETIAGMHRNGRDAP